MTRSPLCSRSRLALWGPLALGLGPVHADTVDIGASKDNTLYEDAQGELSNGSGQHFFTGRSMGGFTSDPTTRRAVIAFDVAGAIPAGATIDGVELILYMDRTTAGDEDHELRRLDRDFGEGASDAAGGEGMGAPWLAPDATWTFASRPAVAWTNVGGDFSATVSATLAVGPIGTYTFGSTPQLVVDVQDMLDRPAGNFGWVLLGNEALNGTAKRWSSLQNEEPAERPVLRIDFTPGPTAFCFGVGCPCANDDASAGCLTSTGSGGGLVANGSTSIATDDLGLDALQPAGNSGLLLVNVAADAPLAMFDGLNCVRGGPRTLPGADNGMAQPFGDVDQVNGDGVRNLGAPVSGGGLIGLVHATFPGFFAPGGYYTAQFWFRDVLCGPPPSPCPSPCSQNANFTHALAFTVEP